MTRRLESPRDKYLHDPAYSHLVQTLEYMLEQAHYTPSELREACILASINYEMRHIRDEKINPQIEESLRILDDYVSKSTRRR